MGKGKTNTSHRKLWIPVLRAVTSDPSWPNLNKARGLGRQGTNAVLDKALLIPRARRLLEDRTPPSLHDLGVGGFTGKRVTLLGELQWSTALLVRAPHLPEILQARSELEIALLNEASDGQKNLEAFIAEYGWSLWAIDAKLFLHRLANHDGAPPEALSPGSIVGCDELVKFSILLADQRHGEQISPARYSSRVTNLLTNISDPESNRALRHIFEPNASTPWTPQALATMLHILGRFSLLDRFDATAHALRESFVITDSEIPPSEQRRLVDELLQCWPEAPSTLRLLEHLTAFPKINEDARRLVEASDLYTSGRYVEALDLLAKEFQARPHVTGLAELFGRAATFVPDYTKALPPKSTVVEEILRASAQFHRRGPDSPQAAYTLQRISQRLAHTTIGRGIATIGSTTPTGASQPNVRALLSTSTSSPRTASLLGSSTLAEKYLDEFLRAFPHSQTVAMFHAVYAPPGIGDKVALPDIPKHRLLRYQANRRETLGDWMSAEQLLSETLESTAPPSIAWSEAYVCLSRARFEQGRFDDAAIALADLYCELPNAFSIALGRKVLTRARRRPLSVEAGMALAILTHACGNAPEAQEFPVHARLESLMVLTASPMPSDLVRHPALNSTGGIFILSRLCTPEAMDWLYMVDSAQELERERISICQRLATLDPGRSGTYETEIEQRLRAIQIRKLKQTMTASRIQVDTDGLVRALGNELEEDFAELEYARTNVRWLDEILAQLGDHHTSRLRTARVVAVQPSSAFARLFTRIKKAFTFGDEYGLDSNLSVRVRHGTLAGQMRSAFDTNHLVTRRKAEGGGYVKNEYWSVGVPPTDQNAIESYFADFSSEIDALIDEVRNEQVQIRTPDRPNAVFDFDFDVEEVISLYAHCADQPRPLMLEAILNALLSRTRSNLELMRANVRTHIRSNLHAALDRLDERMRSRLGQSHPVFDAIAATRTQLQHELSEMESWFQLSDLEGVTPYSLSQAIEASIEVVRGLNNVPFYPRVSVSEDAQLKGKTLRHVLDILSILFSNIVEHGDPSAPPTVDLGRRDDAIVLTIINLARNVSTRQDGAALCAKLERNLATGASENARTEGGSGYYKLGKILRYNLDQPSSRAKVSLQEDGTFTVQLIVPTFSLVVLDKERM